MPNCRALFERSSFSEVKSEQTAAERLETINILKAITICITTRSIGFGFVSVFLSMIVLRNVPTRSNIIQFYRVSLALIESKSNCQRAISMITDHHDGYVDLRNSSDFM